MEAQRDHTETENRNKIMNLKVTLAHVKNPDIRSGGYWQEPVESGKRQTVDADSIEAAAKICREYIERNHLGGGNWVGGKVTQDGKHIADISYNGRAWEPAPKGTLHRTEIKQDGMMTSAELWSLPREERDKVLLAA